MKHLTLCVSSSLRHARLRQAAFEKLECNDKEACRRDEDEAFDLGLDKWGVDVDDLNKVPKAPRRCFRCRIEDWENVMDKGAVMRTKLL